VEPSEPPTPALGPTLACALLAQTASVLSAALVAAQVPGGYRVRSWVFLAALLWSVAGTVLLLVQTAGATARGQSHGIRVGRVALWWVSSWVWPVLVRRHAGSTGDSEAG